MPRLPLGLLAAVRRAAVLAVLATGPAAASGVEGICSLVPLEMRLRIPDMVAFIGTAEGDTVLAGPGSMKYSTEQGHYGPGTSRAIYGQVVRVERTERAAPAPLTAAVTGNGSVVLVPWDFSAGCEPVPWTRSARWLPQGTTGMFVGTLRDRANWVGDRPTFDVTPVVAVYPSPWASARARRVRTGPTLSAEELLSLYEVLPDGRTLSTSPDSAVAPLLRWAQTYPDRAAKQPAAYLLAYVRRSVVEYRYRAKPSPLAGTYRVVYRTPSGDSSAFFVRTETHPNSVIWADRRPPTDSGAARDRAPIGHYLLGIAARTESELPTLRTGASTLEAYFALVDSAIASTAEGTVFPGSVDFEREAAKLVADSAARSRLESAGRVKSAVQTERFRANLPPTPGRFVLAPDGRVSFHMVIERGGAPVLTVRAERISREYLRRPAGRSG